MKYIDICKILYNNRNSIKVNGDYLEFKNQTEITTNLKKHQIEYSKIKDDFIQILRGDLPFHLYFSKDEYLHISNIKNEIGSVIIENEDILSYFDDTEYLNFEPSEDNYFFSNAKIYGFFITFLKKQTKEDESGFHFIDYADNTGRKLVLTSLSEKSRIILKYNNEIPYFNEKRDYSISVKYFMQELTNNVLNISKFIKSSLIKKVTNIPEDQRLIHLFKHIDAILLDAQMNLEIYINNLSIYKIRKDYEEFKKNHLANISEVVNKINNRIISYPIIFSTLIFAVSKIPSQSILLYFLVCAISITVIYLNILTSMNESDLENIFGQAKKEHESIVDNGFFIKFPAEKEEFDNAYETINQKVHTTKKLSKTYKWALILTNLFCVMFIFRKLQFSTNTAIIIGILVLLVTVLVEIKYENNHS
ncbi:MAG: hypothetical protein DSY77_17535 [Bacteroidetes bacterium]|nr:MAG: hypothetical protein DSY77_17535 [Bacteroidota bacterium]